MTDITSTDAPASGGDSASSTRTKLIGRAIAFVLCAAITFVVVWQADASDTTYLQVNAVFTVLLLAGLLPLLVAWRRDVGEWLLGWAGMVAGRRCSSSSPAMTSVVRHRPRPRG